MTIKVCPFFLVSVSAKKSLSPRKGGLEKCRGQMCISQNIWVKENAGVWMTQHTSFSIYLGIVSYLRKMTIKVSSFFLCWFSAKNHSLLARVINFPAFPPLFPPFFLHPLFPLCARLILLSSSLPFLTIASAYFALLLSSFFTVWQASLQRDIFDI